MTRRALACLLSVIAVLVLAGPMPAIAAPALRPDMVRSLESMQQRLAQGGEAAVASQARQAAERLEGGNAADRWARALFLQLAASAEARRGNDARAADLFAEARRIEDAGLERRQQWLNQEARLRLRAGQVEQGVTLLARWLNQVQASEDDVWLMVQGLASLQRWEQAAAWADRARQTDASPDNERLALAASVYQRAGRDKAALAILDALLTRDRDNPDIWRRAAGLAQRMGQPGRAAALWEAAWRQGVLDSDADLKRLVNLHLAGGTPARAAERLAEALPQGHLEDSLANRRLLAQAWTAARDRDRALDAWRDVAQRSGRGKDWQRLGELAYGWGRFSVASEALSQARSAGAEDPRLWLLEGVAQLELDRRPAARRAFEAARQAGVAEAKVWLDVLGEAQVHGMAENGSPASSAGQG